MVRLAEATRPWRARWCLQVGAQRRRRPQEWCMLPGQREKRVLVVWRLMRRRSSWKKAESLASRRRARPRPYCRQHP
eukprot:scaffold50558_cov30-Tisochrysis_lutea.AAC.8